MLKFFFMLFLIFPLSYFLSFYWLVQSLLFLLGFIFIILNFNFNYFGSLGYLFGCDMLSYGLILLSIWICALMLTASSGVYNSTYYSSFFVFNILLLLGFLILTFSTTSLLMFYLFFESSLIPTLFLILGWGYQPERMQAGVYLLFYTLLASLPLLVCIFYIFNSCNTSSFFMLCDFYFFNEFLYYGMILAFLVKMPMFLVHLWLPKAHVEAPVSGSMILAGILLKLGGYGLLRVFSFLCNYGIKLNYLWIGISLLGGFLVSLICLRQVDLKSLIAYSSVAHMGIVLSGLMTMTYWGYCGSYILMIGHGLCSSGLFCLANIVYERSGSRSLLLNKGLLNCMPSMAMWWFLLSSANMAAPPTLNLAGEISLINSVVGWSWVSMFMISLISFFSAAYTLYMYSYSQHGKLYSGLFSFMGGSVREYLLLFLHWLPLNLLILNSDLFVYLL